MNIDIDAIMERIPVVARLYYTGIGSRRYRRASTQTGPGEPLVHRSHVERELKRIAAEFVQAAPDAAADTRGEVAGLSRHSRAMLLNVLWHHQGGSSKVGQPIRTMLGIGEYSYLNGFQVAEAKWIDGLLAAPAHPAAPTAAAHAEATMLDEPIDATQAFVDLHVEYEARMPRASKTTIATAIAISLIEQNAELNAGNRLLQKALDSLRSRAATPTPMRCA